MRDFSALRWRSRLVSLLLALAFALIFYTFNTPLGPSIGSDNAIYLTMGTAIAKGYAPYTEIFDHKGPLLYLVQALPQVIAGGYSTLSVFVQQGLVLLACLRVLCAISRKLHVTEMGVQCVYLALICSLVGGGNLTEEYTALPTLLGLYLVLCTFDGEPQDKLFVPALGMGSFSMLAFLMRANNALPLCAVVLALALMLALCRRFAALARCAGGFLAGCTLVMLPVLLWLYAKGAVSAAFYGAIVHNFLYAETGGGSRLGMLLTSGYGHMALLMAALSLLGAGYCLRGGRRPLAAALAAGALAALLAAFISHKFYDHYLILGTPTAALGAALLLSCVSHTRAKRAVPGICLCLCALWLCISGVKANQTRLAEREGLDTFTADAQTLMAQVPVSQRDQFMAYRVEPKWYVAAEALPCMRFYFLQEILAQADPAVMDEIVQTFESDPPRWLVIYYNRPFDPPYDPRVAEIFATRYAFVASVGQYQLLEYKDKKTEDSE